MGYFIVLLACLLCVWVYVNSRISKLKFIVECMLLIQSKQKEKAPMEMDEARELAAQVWCDPRNSDKVVDTQLAETFAEILVKQLNEVVVKEIAKKRLYGKARTFD